MKYLIIAFLASLLFGQVGAIHISGSIYLYVHDLVLLILYLTTFIDRVKKRSFYLPKLVKPVGIFTSIALLSLLLNIHRFTLPEILVSSLYLARYVFYMGIYVIVVQNAKNSFLWLKGIFFTGTLFSFLGLCQYIFFPNLRSLEILGWDPHYYRLVSTLMDPNFTGILIVMTIFSGFLVVKQKPDILFYIAQSINIIALYLTYSRSSYLAFIVGLWIYLSTFPKKMVLVISIIGIILAIILIPKPGGNTNQLDRVPSTMSRINNWQKSFTLFLGSPVYGYGFNTLRIVADQRDFFSKGKFVINRAGAGIDNSLLFVLATTGIVGFGTFGYLFWKIVRNPSTGKKHKSKYLFSIQAYYAFVFALFIHSMFSNSWFYAWCMIFFWIIVGVMENLQE